MHIVTISPPKPVFEIAFNFCVEKMAVFFVTSFFVQKICSTSAFTSFHLPYCSIGLNHNGIQHGKLGTL